MLDGEAKIMLDLAQPFPKLPSAIKGGFLDIFVPVASKLGRNR